MSAGPSASLSSPRGSAEVGIARSPECPGVPEVWGAVGCAQDKSPEELQWKQAALHEQVVFLQQDHFCTSFQMELLGMPRSLS